MSKKTKQTIIQLLKQEGSLEAAAIASQLNISAMAVRQHLYVLSDEGFVTYKEESREMGRPVKKWLLTQDADQFFPSGYADLTLSLMDSLTEAFGGQAMEQLLEVRNREQINSYKDLLPDDEPLHEKLQIIAHIRTQEGYMAEVQKEDDGSFLLIEKHCPICAAAKVCSGFCTKELELFRAVLGDHVDVKRTEHMMDGKPRCTYRVKG